MLGIGTQTAKRLISLIVLIARLIFLIARYRSFNAHFVCYIFQFVCVQFAGRRRRPIVVER